MSRVLLMLTGGIVPIIYLLEETFTANYTIMSYSDYHSYGSYILHWTGNRTGTGTGIGMDTIENNGYLSLSLSLCNVCST